jgi:hypothetical protein
VRPAQQRLGPGDASRREVDLRLVVELERALGQGAAQVALERGPRSQPGVHLFLEEPVRPAPVRLRAIEC